MPKRAADDRDAAIMAELRDTERAAVGQFLGARPSGSRIVEVVANAENWASDLIERFVPSSSLACQAGCSWCCYLRVSATPAEILALVAFLRATLDPAELTELAASVRAADDRARGLDALGRIQARIPCPLLRSGNCLAYPARPLACRGWTSPSAATCRRVVHGEPTTPMSASRRALLIQEAIGDGLRAGLGRAGLETEPVELIAALRTIFDDPGAPDRWLAGQEVFTAPSQAVFSPNDQQSSPK